MTNKTKNYLLAFLVCLTFFMMAGAAKAFSWGALMGGIGIGGALFGVVLNLIGFGVNGFCWFCDLYKTLFDVMNNLATQISSGMSDMFLMLLGVGILFYLAFKIGGTVVKLQEVDLMQFLGELFKQLGRAIIAAAFLWTSVDMYHYLISPFLAYALGLTNEILSASEGGGFKGLVMSALGGGDVSDYVPKATGGILNEGGRMAFSNEIREQIVGMLEYTSASLIVGIAIGGLTILCSWGIGEFGLPSFQVATAGFVILGAYLSVYLAVPFKLIDVMVRLTFVAALTPLWIILWVFPPTISYTKNAWEMLLNCCACFIAMGVVLVIVFEILEAMLPDKMGIISYLISGAEMMAFGTMQIANPSLLQTFALGILATQLIKNSSNIATQIVKSYGTSIGEGLDAKVSKGLQGMGKFGAAVGGAAIGMMEGGLNSVMDGAKKIMPSNSWDPFDMAHKTDGKGNRIDAITGEKGTKTNPARSEQDLLNSGWTRDDINRERRKAAAKDPGSFYYDTSTQTYIPKSYVGDNPDLNQYRVIKGVDKDTGDPIFPETSGGGSGGGSGSGS